MRLRICLTWVTFSTRLFLMLTPPGRPKSHQEALIFAHRVTSIYPASQYCQCCCRIALIDDNISLLCRCINGAYRTF